MRSPFIYKKQYTLRYAIFHENFEFGIYIQKNHNTSQKARQFALRFIYKNPDTFRYAVFHGISEIGGWGGHFYMQ